MLIETRELSKVYRSQTVMVQALDNVNVSIEAGEMVAVMGPSGSGKSTLMNILGCLDLPTSGTYYLEGRDVTRLSRDELATLRNSTIGFVFQGFNLIPSLSALYNVELPLVYAGIPRGERHRTALDSLEAVGLGGKAKALPPQLSGGEQQRVAIARAMVNRPRLLLADEPTGNLDTRTGKEIMDLFVSLNQHTGLTLVIVTHDPEIAAHCHRTITMRDGKVENSRQ